MPAPERAIQYLERCSACASPLTRMLLICSVHDASQKGNITGQCMLLMCSVHAAGQSGHVICCCMRTGTHFLRNNLITDGTAGSQRRAQMAAVL